MTAYNPSKWMYSTWAGFSCVTSSFSLILRLPCKLRWSCWRSFAIWKSYFYHQQKMEGRNKQTNSDTKSKLKPYSPTPDDCCILDDMTYIKNITAVSNLTGFTKQCSMSFLNRCLYCHSLGFPNWLCKCTRANNGKSRHYVWVCLRIVMGKEANYTPRVCL